MEISHLVVGEKDFLRLDAKPAIQEELQMVSPVLDRSDRSSSCSTASGEPPRGWIDFGGRRIPRYRWEEARIEWRNGQYAYDAWADENGYQHVPEFAGAQ